MQFNKIKVCAKADQHLRHLKAKTGLTPNLLARYGFCLSLRDPKIPNPNHYDEEAPREFNRYTLTGEWDGFFMALLRQRCWRDGLDESQLESQFRAHLNRGILTLSQQVKSSVDLLRVAEEARTNKLEV